MTAKQITNDDIFKLTEVSKQNEEIKSEIEAIKTEVAIEIGKLKIRNTELDEENKKLRQRILITERKLRKYNVIVYGVQEKEGQIDEQILKIINEKLNIECNINEIRDVYRIGLKKSNSTRPTVIEFVTYRLKTDVLKKGWAESRKLKEYGLSFNRDYISEDYEKIKLLRKHLKLARERHYTANIKNNILIVNGEEYTYDQLKQIDENKKPPQEETENIFEDNTDVLNKSGSHNKTILSEPSTPNVFNFPSPPIANVEEMRSKPEEITVKPTGTKPKVNTRGNAKRSNSHTEL